MSVEHAKELAGQVSRLLSGHPLIEVATALSEVVAVLIHTMEPDDRDSQRRIATRLADAAFDLAGAITQDVVAAAEAMEQEEERRIAELATAGPKRKSPWGDVR